MIMPYKHFTQSKRFQWHLNVLKSDNKCNIFFGKSKVYFYDRNELVS